MIGPSAKTHVHAAGRRGDGAPPAEARLYIKVWRAPREPTWRRRGSRDSTKRTVAESQSPSAGDDASPTNGGIFRNARSVGRRCPWRTPDGLWGSPAGRRPTDGSTSARGILVG